MTDVLKLEDVEKRVKPEKVSYGGLGETIMENAGAHERRALRNEKSKSLQIDDLATEEEKKRKEKWVDKMIDSSIDRVKLVKPNMLKGQVTNSLEKAMEYSFKLKDRAEYSSLDEAEFKAVGKSMEEYAFHLIEPLKTDIIKRAIFEGKDFDRIADKAVSSKQKKFLAHPVVFNLLRRRWAGQHFYWQNSTLFELNWFRWIFLNLWTLFDFLLFPIIHVILYLIHKVGLLRKTRGTKSYRRDAFESYHTYFMTPYFIFLRDTWSYFVLLALHFVMCNQASTIHLTVIEWLIMLFFLGRFMIEIYQAAVGIKNEKEVIENETRSQKCKLFRMLNKYLSDQWNVLDSITLVVYATLVILRVYTWYAYTSVLNNRPLAVAGYLYGLNSMLLTLRLFGHIMELKESTGTIQTALFQIIGAVLAVFGQFFSVLIAFSLAITKINMAEVSFTGVTNTSSFEGICTDQDRISCWWKTTRHLIWSLLVEPNLLLSSDKTSSSLIQILYGVFLLLSVVMLMNMMIALLTNTYQQVENNAFYEWSYKKAATIRTYCNYHSVPVPFNIISLTFILLHYICKNLWCRKCYTSKYVTDNDFEKEQKQNALYKKSFSEMIMELESMYYSVYGDEFPITGERLDHIVEQTNRNHLLIGHIAQRLFSTSYKETQCLAPQNFQEWEVKGIFILDNRLSYTSCECDECKTVYKDYHGARYRIPLSVEMPGFEILIEQDNSTKHDIVLGVVTDDFDLHKVPGMEGNTVGYRVDKEIISDINTQRINCWQKIDHLPEMADRGDLLGCEILYGRQSDNYVPVLFTLNGRVIGEATIKSNLLTSEKFYAFIGIGSQEISVRFRKRCMNYMPTSLDETPKLLKQVIGQLDQLNKNYLDLKEDIDALRSEMRTKLDNK